MIPVALTGEPIPQPFPGYHNEGSMSFSPTPMHSLHYFVSHPTSQQIALSVNDFAGGEEGK